MESPTTGAQSLARIEGPNLTLRLITLDDAAYVHGLRSNPVYNRYLSEVRGSVEDQRAWIESYKAREARLFELYYVIERKDHQRCGLVRLYNIGRESFTWGSWILDENKPRKAALESVVLSFGVGFDRLDCDEAVLDVRIENHHARAFYTRFGIIETRRTDQDIYFIYPKSTFKADRDGHLALLSSEGLT